MAKQDKNRQQAQSWDTSSDAESQLEAETGSEFTQTGSDPVTFAETDAPAPQAPATQADLAPGQVGSVVDSAIAAASAANDEEQAYIYNEDTKEMRQVTARKGYAPTPMPNGFRLARPDEVTRWQQEQGK